MIATANHQQHGKAGTARGHCAFVGIEVSRLSPVAYDEQQVCRAVSSDLFDVFLPVRTGLGFGRGLFPQFTIAIHSGWHRQAIARTRWPAVQILRDRFIAGRAHSFGFPQHIDCQVSNAAECHRLKSFGVTFQHPNRDTAQRTKSWKLQPAKSAP